MNEKEMLVEFVERLDLVLNHKQTKFYQIEDDNWYDRNNGCYVPTDVVIEELLEGVRGLSNLIEKEIEKFGI